MILNVCNHRNDPDLDGVACIGRPNEPNCHALAVSLLRGVVIPGVIRALALDGSGLRLSPLSAGTTSHIPFRKLPLDLLPIGSFEYRR